MNSTKNKRDRKAVSNCSRFSVAVRMRALVLDDDESRRAWFKAHLRNTVCVTTSAEAIAALTAGAQRGENFSTLFCDRHLGNRTKNGIGDDVVDHLSEHADRYPDLRVILHTTDEAAAYHLVQQLVQVGIKASACPFGSEPLRDAVNATQTSTRPKTYSPGNKRTA